MFSKSAISSEVKTLSSVAMVQSALQAREMKGTDMNRLITLKSGMIIPSIGLGTLGLTDEASIKTVQDAIDMGYQFIDTAIAYNNHTIIGKALEKYDRKNIIICSKINGDSVKVASVESIVDKMLAELKTSYIDMVLIHSPLVPEVENFPQVLSELIKLKKAGKIKSIGVSNFEIRHLEMVRDQLEHIDVNQVEFHPYLYQKDLFEYCKAHNIHIMGYRPFGKGKIDVLQNPELQKMAEEHKSSVSKVILRSMVQGGHSAIVKASSKQHMEDNRKIYDFKLSDKEMSDIQALNKGLRTCSGTKWFDFDEKFPIKEIHANGKVDVMNIEGGNEIKVLKEGALWLNLATIYDTPFANGVTYNDLKVNSGKERDLKDYDEVRIYLALILILNYYVNHGHALVNKSEEKPLNIVIHTHRGDASSAYVTKCICDLLMKCFPEQFKEISSESISSDKQLPMLKVANKNIVIKFRNGYGKPLTDSVYAEADIVLSNCIAAGLKHDAKTGTMTLPHRFIPFDSEKYQLFPEEAYSKDNHLIKTLDQILAQPQEKYFDKVDAYFKTVNPAKQHKARKITRADFELVTLAQLTKSVIFNPEDPQRYFEIVQAAKKVVNVQKLEPTSVFRLTK